MPIAVSTHKNVKKTQTSSAVQRRHRCHQCVGALSTQCTYRTQQQVATSLPSMNKSWRLARSRSTYHQS
eukprot:4820426-Prorocentrum_lima.AAC.1